MKTKNIIFSGALLTGAVLVYRSIKKIPRNVKTVNPFYLEKYMGKWYELARMNHLFSKNITDTTVSFHENSWGEIEVINHSYNKGNREFEKTTGKIKISQNPMKGKLKISYLGPLYSNLYILAVSDDYKYSLVAGKNLSHLFILSRERDIPDNILDEYLKLANRIGFDLSKLDWVKHTEEYEDKFEEMECIIVEGFT